MQARIDPQMVQQLRPPPQQLPSPQPPLCRIVFGSWEYRDLVVPLPLPGRPAGRWMEAPRS